MGTAIGISIGIPFSRGTGFPAILSDGTISMRKVVRDGYLCTDLTIAGRPLGFSGVQDTDWECVESVKTFQNDLIFEFTTVVPNKSITLTHLENDGAGYNYVYNYDIDWGDGSPVNNITAFNDADLTHVYVNTGTYIAKISGTCEQIENNMTTSDMWEILTKVLHWGNTGLKQFTFMGCSGLTSIAGDNDGFSLITNFRYAFGGCEVLSAIPPGLFDKCPLATTFRQAFEGCYIIPTIPQGLFDNCPLVTTFLGTFYTCKAVTSIPSGLFDHNPLVTTFQQTFWDTLSIVTIPSGLFDNNPLVTNMYGVFGRSCNTVLLETIPSGLFDHNPLVTTFAVAFQNNILLQAIPDHLFDNNVLVTTFADTFKWCETLTTIPDELFDFNVNVTTFSTCFGACTGLTGNAPDLWVTHAAAIGTLCFNNCPSIANLASIPAGWK